MSVPLLALKALKLLGLVLLALTLALGLFLWWAQRGAEPGAEREWLDLAPEELGVPPEAAAGDTVTVLSWNIAYGRGPKDDAGDLRDEATVRRFLDAIAAAIVRSGADVVALQEVDFAAARTHGIDQLAYLAERTGLRHAARCTTWKNNYVPYPFWPPSQHYGPMHSGQAVLSRFPIVSNGRLRYAQPAGNPSWYNLFYLHRATQRVSVELSPGRHLTLFNTHLEAFDQPNRELQADRLARLLEDRPGSHTLLLGDFNALPPEATKKREFVDEPDQDFTLDRTIATLREATGYLEVVARDVAAHGEPASFTFPADAPTRQLDHVFFSGDLALEEGAVWREAGAVSDHVPIRAVFGLR